MLPSINSHSDVATELAKLADRIKKLLNAQSYPTSDARDVALKNWLALTYVVAGHMYGLSHGATGAISEADLRKLYNITGPLQLFSDASDAFFRLAYLTLCLFQVENMFGNLLRELTQAPPPKGYYNVCTAVVSAVGSLHGGDHQTLMVSAHQRNSLHANGIHHGYQGSDTHTTVRGVPFDFVDGRRVECAGFAHIITSLGGTLDVVEVLVVSPEVSSLSTPIADAYVASTTSGTDP